MALFGRLISQPGDPMIAFFIESLTLQYCVGMPRLGATILDVLHHRLTGSRGLAHSDTLHANRSLRANQRRFTSQYTVLTAQCLGYSHISFIRAS
jgi:hypothetical protein